MHAAIRIGAGNTARLERIARYIGRPPLAQDRLAIARDGSIVYRFRKPWRNGKRAVVMDPMTFLSRLAALIPPPRFHMLSYYGVLAPAASRRAEIVPEHAEDDEDTRSNRCSAATRPANGSAVATEKAVRRRPERKLWAELVRRVFLTDVLRVLAGSPSCAGDGLRS